jgi:hypothetical protein
MEENVEMEEFIEMEENYRDGGEVEMEEKQRWRRM